MSKNRQFSPDFKVQAVLELLTGVHSASEICREHQIRDNLLYRWKQEFLERAPQLFTPKGTETSCEQAHIAELEQALGRLTMELEASKKASRLLGSRLGRREP
jgi:transposase